MSKSSAPNRDDVARLKDELRYASRRLLRTLFRQPDDPDARDKYRVLARVVENVAGRQRWRTDPTRALIDTVAKAIATLPETMSGRLPGTTRDSVGKAGYAGRDERDLASILFGYRDGDILASRGIPRDSDEYLRPLTYDTDYLPYARAKADLLETEGSVADRMGQVIREDLAYALLDEEKRALRGGPHQRVFDRIVDPEIMSLCKGRTACGNQIVIQAYPGSGSWSPSEIKVLFDHSEYSWPSTEMEAWYLSWLASATDREKRGVPKYRLIRNPAAFTDDPTLELHLQANTWPRVRFVNREISATRDRRTFHASRILGNIHELPNMLVLEVAVATNDDQILLTQRSPVVAYHAESWSCSIEEQLAEADFAGSDVVSRWVARTLSEELALSDQDVADVETQISAVFLETDTLNIAVGGLITLSLTRDELDSILRTRRRTDYEFSDWTFIDTSQLAHEVVQPQRVYHPSSRLRMLLAGELKYGSDTFLEMLDAEIM